MSNTKAKSVAEMSWHEKIIFAALRVVEDSCDEVWEFAEYMADGSYAGKCVSLRLWDDGDLVCDEQVSCNSFPAGEHYTVCRLEGYPDGEPCDVNDIIPDVVEWVEDALYQLARDESRVESILLDYLEDHGDGHRACDV